MAEDTTTAVTAAVGTLTLLFLLSLCLWLRHHRHQNLLTFQATQARKARRAAKLRDQRRTVRAWQYINHDHDRDDEDEDEARQFLISSLLYGIDDYEVPLPFLPVEERMWLRRGFMAEWKENEDDEIAAMDEADVESMFEAKFLGRLHVADYLATVYAPGDCDR